MPKLPKRSVKEWMEIEEGNQLPTYPKYPFVLTRGEGCYVWDTEGNRYMDLYAGHAVCSTGHCHPRVVKAIQEQAAQLIFYSNISYSDIRAEATQALIEAAPKDITKVFFCNSGAEANETALKMARKHTGKKVIIGMKGGFHGRTMGAISATALSNYRETTVPHVEEHVFADFGDIAAVEKLITDDTAAVHLEPIQSMYGCATAPAKYHQDLRKLCDDAGILLIYDEVQTGNGRCGTYFIGENWGVTPDLIATAKGLASGFPMGATLCTEAIAEKVEFGDQGSTFGGGMLACAALLATVQTIKGDGLLENVKTQSARLTAGLKKLKHVKAIHGMGLLLGIEFDGPCRPWNAKLRDEYKILIGVSSVPNVSRLLPPLNMGDEETKAFLEAITAIDKAGV